MKHAYLILAHNEFDLLNKLIAVLDDARNDIFIHFDSKVNTLPIIECNFSGLYILEDRVDVRWGDVSVVSAEYKLFQKASQKANYSYYHLLSGVDMPLKSQDYIHNFFKKNQGKEFVGFYQQDITIETELRVRKFHLFPHDFRADTSIVGLIKKIVRAVTIRLQYLIGFSRNKDIDFKKGTQWISITHDFLELIIQEKENVLEIYKNTFCADEIFIQTLCWNSVFKANVFNIDDEAQGSQRMIGWNNNMIIEWEGKDFERLIDSNLLFARKFSSNKMEVVNRLIKYIK
ncbi:beta-1,6-N-acetylglucosaminyltransferase [Chryseobacterium sp.]|uniref:beta-1,6-N-acetylglucosaminyltransferase n=1 Tax=Chryseobacterium sp. TaxID=1871047 RepID=UPI00388D93A9